MRTIMNMTIYLLVLMTAFISFVVWVFSRKRKARFERDARIPSKLAIVERAGWVKLDTFTAAAGHPVLTPIFRRIAATH
jgi:cytochrome c oxidase cbb3-type subunit 4